MKDLNLNEWLRYFLSGGIFVLLFLYVINSSSCNKEIHLLKKQIEEIESIYSGIGISLIIGAVIYSLHRSLIYPFILRIFEIILSKIMKEKNFSWDLFCPVRPPDSILKATKERWENSYSEDNKNTKVSIVKKLSEWASQVHFLYCTSWSLLLLILFISKYRLPSHNLINSAFCIFITASIIHHLRYLYFEHRLMSGFEETETNKK